MRTRKFLKKKKVRLLHCWLGSKYSLTQIRKQPLTSVRHHANKQLELSYSFKLDCTTFLVMATSLRSQFFGDCCDEEQYGAKLSVEHDKGWQCPTQFPGLRSYAVPSKCTHLLSNWLFKHKIFFKLLLRL